MTDLPYNAVRVDVEGALVEFIGANGEVLGMRVMGKPRRYRCAGCGSFCRMATLSDRAPECPKHDIRADWKIVTEEEWQQAVRQSHQMRQRTAPQLRENEEEIHGSR